MNKFTWQLVVARVKVPPKNDILQVGFLHKKS